MALRVPLFGRPPDRPRAKAEPAPDSASAAKPKRKSAAKSTSAARAKRTAKSGTKSAPKSASKATKAARSTTSATSAAAKSAAKRPAKATAKGGPSKNPAKGRSKASAASSATKRAPRAKSAPKSRKSNGTSARSWWPWPTADRAAKRRPGPARPSPFARKGTRTREDEGGHVPPLQRRTTGALLGRAAVLAVAFVAMVAFAVALAKVTLVPSPASDALVHTNLRPGASIRAYLDQPAIRDSVKQIGGNILLGVPFGVLLPALFPRTRGLVRVAAVTALIMVLVETAQGAIVEGRAFDIDDVILNTSGALLGYLPLGRRLGRALHPHRRHWWHRLGFGTPPPPDPAPDSADRPA